MTDLAPTGLGHRLFNFIWVVLVKELRDHMRDHRSLMLALIYPILGPLLVGVLLNITSTTMKGKPAGELTLAAIGTENAPGLKAFFLRHKVTLKPAPADPEAAVRSGAEPVILIVPRQAAGSGSVKVRLLIDLNRMANGPATQTVMRLLVGFSREATRKRLKARNIDLAILQPLVVEQISVGRKPNIATVFYKMIPPLIMFMVFLGGTYMAIDMTAGERERGSLEPLLSAPVPRWQLLFGKAIAAFAFTAITLVVNYAAFVLMLQWATTNNPSLTSPPGALVFIAMYLVTLPLMALAVTMQMAIAAVSRSMKEAQIYLGLLPVIPALPGVAMAFSPPGAQAWIAMIPGFSQMMLFNELLSGKEVQIAHVALSYATTGLAAFAFFWWTTRLFHREKTLFLG